MDILKPSEAESAIIGILASGKITDYSCINMLSKDSFTDMNAAKVFAAIRGITLHREPLSLMGIDEQLTRLYGQHTAQDAMQYVLTAVRENALQSWQLSKFIVIVSEAAQRRKLVDLGIRISQCAADGQQEISTLIDESRNTLRDCISSKGGWVSVGETCLAAYNAAEASEKLIPTGFSELDAILCGGLHKGELTILGARPAVGKSAVLLAVSMAAAKSGANVCFVSLEMSGQQIGTRVLSAKSGLNAGLLRGGKLPNDAWTGLADALLELDNELSSRLTFLARGGMTIEDLRAETQSQYDAGKCDLLVIDYLQLLRTKQRTGSDFERLGIVSRGLKGLTLDLGIPILAAAQVRRQNNMGGGLRAPGMDELRGSGDLEQDADNIMLLHRVESSEDAVLNTNSYKNRHTGLFESAQENAYQLLTIEVAKQRQGMTARAWTVFDPAHMRFFDAQGEL